MDAVGKKNYKGLRYRVNPYRSTRKSCMPKWTERKNISPIGRKSSVDIPTESAGTSRFGNYYGRGHSGYAAGGQNTSSAHPPAIKKHLADYGKIVCGWKQTCMTGNTIHSESRRIMSFCHEGLSALACNFPQVLNQDSSFARKYLRLVLSVKHYRFQ